MPAHGIKTDAEFLGIVLTAGVTGYLITGDLISNMLFTALISVLFFLIGINIDIRELKKCLHHREEVGLGLLMIYVFAPMLAFGIYRSVGGPLGDAFIAIGISASAVGTPVVFSNRSGGEGNLALVVSGISLLLAFILVPILLSVLGLGFDITDIALKNLAFLGIPLALGVSAQRFENLLLDDLRHHFSKLGLWLILLIMLIQFRLVYLEKGLGFLQNLGIGVVLMSVFVILTFSTGYYLSRILGFNEPQSRALGFTSGSKGIAIALFIASQISGEAVMYVSIYYFIRQGITGAIMEYFRRPESFSISRLSQG